ncbi:hypothetical protein RintRC_0777 [Richelia intracellularis]|nr:hypothetical protein RintRC_0777 [Richelia intracellularis]
MSPIGIGTSRFSSPKATQQAMLWFLMVGVNQYLDKKLPSLSYSAIYYHLFSNTLTDITQ